MTWPAAGAKASCTASSARPRCCRTARAFAKSSSWAATCTSTRAWTMRGSRWPWRARRPSMARPCSTTARPPPSRATPTAAWMAPSSRPMAARSRCARAAWSWPRASGCATGMAAGPTSRRSCTCAPPRACTWPFPGCAYATTAPSPSPCRAAAGAPPSRAGAMSPTWAPPTRTTRAAWTMCTARAPSWTSCSKAPDRRSRWTCRPRTWSAPSPAAAPWSARPAARPWR